MGQGCLLLLGAIPGHIPLPWASAGPLPNECLDTPSAPTAGYVVQAGKRPWMEQLRKLGYEYHSAGHSEARPSKAGRWPEETTLQPLHRKPRPRKSQGLPKAPEQVQTETGPPESQAEPTPLAAPPVQYWFHNNSASGSYHAPGSCSGSSIWIYLVLQRGQEREGARSDPTSLPREGACGGF